MNFSATVWPCGRASPRDMSTAEFGALLREPAPEPRRGRGAPPGEAEWSSGDEFDEAFRD